MKMTARGWNRNMGWNNIGEFDLTCARVARDKDRTVSPHSPVIFDNYSNIEVNWYKELHLGGNFWMKAEFSYDEIISMFKTAFGSELQAELLERHGFTFSKELVDRALSTVKLSDITPDITLGQLASLQEQTSTPTEKPTDNVQPFIRRRF